jgi:hypothetical protein
MLSEVQLTVAVDGVPVSSTNGNADALLAPIALFQLLRATTPATSELPIAVVLEPTKSMLIALLPGEDETTFSVTVAECMIEPLVPVTVIVEAPNNVLADAFTVSTEAPDPLIELGLNEAVAPDGRPLMLNVTTPELAELFTPTLKLVLLPGTTFCTEGVTDSEKSGVTVIVRVGGLGSVIPELSITVSEAT